MYDEICHPPQHTIIHGLKRGLSKFAGPTKIAAILGLTSDAQPKLFGDVELFETYAEAVKEVFASWPDVSGMWTLPTKEGQYQYGKIPGPYIQLWRVECLPTAREIVEYWLAAASERLEKLILATPGDNDYHLSPMIGAEMEHFAVKAVAGQIRKLRNSTLGNGALVPGMQCEVWIAELLHIAKATEEGTSATGTLAIVGTGGPKARIAAEKNTDLTAETISTVATFENPISLTDHKHVAKILKVVSSGGCLLAEHTDIKSIIKWPPNDALVAKFKRGTADLQYGNTKVARIVKGEVVYMPEERSGILQDLGLPPEGNCQDLIRNIMKSCTDSQHGCTIVVADDPSKLELSGHNFITPISNIFDVTPSMAAVDGAMLVDFAGNIYGFGYLLDGETRPEIEKRSRGARYNSALRFSSKTPGVFVIVASEDGPVTVFQNGSPIHSDPLAESLPPATGARDSGIDLDEWIASITEVNNIH